MGDSRYIPKRNKLYEISRDLKQFLFHNTDWRLDYKTMITLLDIVSKGRPIINPHKIPFGQAIDATNNIRNILHKVGIQGTYHKRQAKQAICCSVMNVDANRCLRNRKLLKSLLPHKDADCRRLWINQCL